MSRSVSARSAGSHSLPGALACDRGAGSHWGAAALTTRTGKLYEDNDTPPPEPTPLIPRERIIASVTWEIRNKVLEAQREEPDLRQSPDRCLYVPRAVRSAALAWGHSSRFSCHPGVQRTEMLLRQHFWWPGLTADAKEFVGACAT
ncbi:hypothetical protein AOLI_G00285910 [Acnodon oligacanthus]